MRYLYRVQAKVLAMDKTADLAVVQLEVPPGRRLPVAEIGRSSTLRAGEFVVAMGSPMGLVETCTLGIVSSVARRKSDLCEGKNAMKVLRNVFCRMIVFFFIGRARL